MKPRYTINIIDHEEDTIDTFNATSAVVLSTETSTEEELKTAFEEMRRASPKVEVRFNTESRLDLLFLENSMQQRMKSHREKDPEFETDVREGISRYIRSLQQETSAPDAGGDRTESSSLVARLLDKEAK